MTGDDSTPDPYQCFVDSDIVGENVGEWKIGVRQLLPTELDSYPNVASLPTSVPGNPLCILKLITGQILCFLNNNARKSSVFRLSVYVFSIFLSKLHLHFSFLDEWKENKEFNQDYVLYPVELTCAYTESGSSVIKKDGVKVQAFYISLVELYKPTYH